MKAEDFRRTIHVHVADTRASTNQRLVRAAIDVANRGAQPLCNRGSGGAMAFNVTTNVRRDGRRLHRGTSVRGPHVLLPNTTESLVLTIALPAQAGRYEIDVLPVLEAVTLGAVGSTLAVEVVSAEPRYHATIAVR